MVLTAVWILGRRQQLASGEMHEQCTTVGWPGGDRVITHDWVLMGILEGCSINTMPQPGNLLGITND